MTFVSRLKNARVMAGITPSELARLCGVPRTYFSQLERLKTDVGLTRAAAAAKVLGLSLDYLALEVGAPPTVDAVREAVALAQRDPERVRRAIAAALGIPHRAPSSIRTHAPAHRSRSRAKHLTRTTEARS